MSSATVFSTKKAIWYNSMMSLAFWWQAISHWSMIWMKPIYHSLKYPTCTLWSTLLHYLLNIFMMNLVNIVSISHSIYESTFKNYSEQFKVLNVWEIVVPTLLCNISKLIEKSAILFHGKPFGKLSTILNKLRYYTTELVPVSFYQDTTRLVAVCIILLRFIELVVVQMMDCY